MRFAHVPPTEPEAKTPATDFFKRIIGGEPVAERQTGQPIAELPLDLDQRVRLVGEW